MSGIPGVSRGSSQRSQLADAVSTCVRAYTGRGPLSTQVLLNDNTVVVVMRDSLTKGEQVLVEHGHDGAGSVRNGSRGASNDASGS
ncbi:MAG: DUF2294 family protein [Patulibacter sp.]|nr:DUF2294 family protein [Patulibacter sp.]